MTSQWQPISTAPTDQEFLIYFPSFQDDDGYVSESFLEVCRKWSDGSIVGSRTHSEYLAATHWMPLPSPPEVSA